METEVDHALASPEVSPGDVCVTASPGQPISRTDRIEAALALGQRLPRAATQRGGRVRAVPNGLRAGGVHRSRRGA